MSLSTRKMFDRIFSGVGGFSVILLSLSLLVILLPIFIGGIKALVFRGTIEYRLMMNERFGRGNRAVIQQQLKETLETRQPVFDMLEHFETEIRSFDPTTRREYRLSLTELKDKLREFLGPFPDEAQPVLLREQYGQTRWDRAQVKLRDVLFVQEYDYSDPTKMGTKVFSPRKDRFTGTSLESLFPYLEKNAERMMLPRLTFYWRFLFDESYDAHFFGGIWAELLGTLYLTIGAMIFAVPMGVIAAIFLVEYAGDNRITSFLRTCISTLAGVPSIVFGLFGLAFFINTMHVSHSKSVLAGSITLAILVLPTVIRASEEAIRSVPHTYKEAALSVGAGKWRTIMTVILPAALPGILTGIIISMGRAAGETAPIIFTAAVSVGKPLQVWQTFTQPTPALPWNIYNLCTEHEAVDEIRHIQFGMVLILVLLVMVLNVTAIVLRARISKKLKG
jgi:phosphate transport system permease protein